MVSMSGNGADRTLVLRPNLSLSWRQAKVFLAVVALLLAVLASGFAARGFWPVLPLAGAEWLALAAAFYVVQRRGHRMEVVFVRGEQVAVAKGIGRTYDASWEFPRGWVRVRLFKPRIRGHPSRLVLSMHDEEVGLGDFLAEDERRQAAALLLRTLARPLPGPGARLGTAPGQEDSADGAGPGSESGQASAAPRGNGAARNGPAGW